MALEVVGESGRFGHLGGCGVHAAQRSAGQRLALQAAQDVDGDLVGLECLFGDVAVEAVDTRHVGLVAVEVAVHVDHDCHAGAENGAIGAEGKSRALSGAAEQEVVWRGDIGVVTGQDAAEVDFHLCACQADDAQAAFCAELLLNLYLELDVAHALPVEMRYAAIGGHVVHAVDTHELLLVGGLDHAGLGQEWRCVGGLDIAEGGAQALVVAVAEGGIFETHGGRQRDAAAEQRVGNLLRLADIDDAGTLPVGPDDKPHGFADLRDVDVAAENETRGIKAVGVAAHEHGAHAGVAHELLEPGDAYVDVGHFCRRPLGCVHVTW